jgi:hypothetical protein
MRRDETSRHGRAADALIASYLRELIFDDEPRPPATDERDVEAPAAALAPPPEELAAEATL